MKRLVIFLSCVLGVQAQGIINDWRGASASVVASTTCGAAQCTEITTTETHGLATGYYVGITGGSGNWVRINTQQGSIYVKQAWDQAATSVIVSDTTRMEPTAGASWALFATSEGASYGCPSNGNETLTMSSITDSRTAVFTRGTPAHNHCPEDQIIGPTNRNDGFGTVAKSWQITVIDSTHYTIPLDSHLLGAFTGTLVITHGTSVGGQIFVPYTGDGDPNALNIQTNHTAQWVMDSCNTAVPLRCANAYTDPMNQFGYGTWATLSTQSGCSSPCMVVSGGTGTIVFSTGWMTSGGSSNYRALAANAMCWLWGFNEPGGEPWGTINRMWPIASVTGTGATGTTITFAGMNAAGIADGNYTLQTGKTTKNFYFPFSGEEYIYFTSGATDTNYPTEWPTTLVQSNGDPTSSSWNRWSGWWMPGANFSAQMVYSSFVRNGAAAGVGFKPYSTLVLDFFSGQWLFHRVSTWPDHLESASAPWVPAGADAIWNGSIGYQAQEIQPGLLHYEQGTRVYYMNLTSLGSNIPAQTGYLGPFTYSNISNEPEEWTSDLAATYDGSAYHVYVRAPATQRNGAAVQYNFYYNTSSSHLAGNISGATSFATGVAAVTSYAGVNLSTSQAQATSTQSLLSTLYLDVQPI